MASRRTRQSADTNLEFTLGRIAQYGTNCNTSFSLNYRCSYWTVFFPTTPDRIWDCVACCRGTYHLQPKKLQAYACLFEYRTYGNYEYRIWHRWCGNRRSPFPYALSCTFEADSFLL